MPAPAHACWGGSKTFLKLLFIGDVVGKPGRKALSLLEKVIGREHIDFTIVNIENAAGGFGVTAELFADMTKLPIDVFTSGNHIWDKKEFVPLLGDLENLLRPANYPPGNPGRGWAIQDTPSGIPVGVLNLQGQVFMANTDSPFRVGDQALVEMKAKRPDLKVVVVDIHAEATSEKQAIGWGFGGRATPAEGNRLSGRRRDDGRVRGDHRLRPESHPRKVPLSDAALDGDGH